MKRRVKASEEVQKQIRKSEHTKDLANLDEKRDRIYRGMVLRLQSEELSEEWVNWLATVNKDFETLYDQRRDDYAEQPTIDMKNIRKELNTSFKKI